MERSYDKTFLKEFSKRCGDLESSEQRQSYTESVIEFVNELYDETLSGEAPARRSSRVRKVSSALLGPRQQRLKRTLTVAELEGEGTIDEVLHTFHRMVIENGYNPLSGSIFGFVGNSTNYISVLGASIAAYLPFITTIHHFTPGACELELRVVNWLCSIVGYGKGSCGYLASGTSAANVEAFMMARDQKLESASLYDKSVVYISELTHCSALKGLKVVGLANCHVKAIPIDKDFRMDTNILEKTVEEDSKSDLKPFLVIGTAGTTDAGSIDPLDEIARIAKRFNLWFHVDGAIGGVCMLSPRVQTKLQAVKLSDSISVDCHKVLFQPPGIGAILVREGNVLKHDMAVNELAYLKTKGESQYSPKDYSFELSRPMRGLSLWFSLKILGEDFFREVIEEKLALAQYFADQLLTIPGMKLYNEPELVITLFRYEPPGEEGKDDETSSNVKLEKLLTADRRIYFHGTPIKGKRYLRVCISTFRTHIMQVDALLDNIKDKIAELDLEE